MGSSSLDQSLLTDFFNPGIYNFVSFYKRHNSRAWFGKYVDGNCVMCNLGKGELYVQILEWQLSGYVENVLWLCLCVYFHAYFILIYMLTDTFLPFSECLREFPKYFSPWCGLKHVQLWHLSSRHLLGYTYNYPLQVSSAQSVCCWLACSPSAWHSCPDCASRVRG